MSEDDFEPRLGRMKSRGSKRGANYLGQVVAATARAGGVAGKRSSRFDGSRIGRGASIGRVLSSRDRHPGLRSRRVVVKTRLVRLGAKGLSAARAHMKYIQRDGVTREGAPGTLYSAELDQADGKAFLERADGDRHQFRFIVSAEDASEYPDLKPFIRRLMKQVEADLGSNLDWVAVDHFNTGHPHTHVVLRGKDDRGKDLVIAREYIAHGFRERATALVTLDLGARTDAEIEDRLRHDISQERLTEIDRRLLRDMDADRGVGTVMRDRFQQTLRVGRLQKLGGMGLAEHVGGGRWRLAEGFDDTLRRIGERGDIIRMMQREMTARKLDRPGVGHAIFDPSSGNKAPVVGRVITRGLSDELRNRHYLLVDGIEGRVHHVDIGRGDAVEPIFEGAIVRVSPRTVGVRDVDRTIGDIAAANGGRYSTDLHLLHDRAASAAFVQAHVRRLEAMRRLTRNVEREVDGTWIIAADHLERAATYEAQQSRDRPVSVEILSNKPLAHLVGFDGATWLDHSIVGEEPEPIRVTGFGKEVVEAQAVRRRWLLDQGLAEEQAGHVRFRANLIAVLQRRELLRVAGQLSRELCLPFVEAETGTRIEGKLSRKIDLVSSRFAVVESSREFTLVPWRETLERKIGHHVSGVMRDDGISWSIGRGRGGPSIS